VETERDNAPSITWQWEKKKPNRGEASEKTREERTYGKTVVELQSKERGKLKSERLDESGSSRNGDRPSRTEKKKYLGKNKIQQGEKRSGGGIGDTAKIGVSDDAAKIG